jgi:hypothetical protein
LARIKGKKGNFGGMYIPYGGIILPSGINGINGPIVLNGLNGLNGPNVPNGLNGANAISIVNGHAVLGAANQNVPQQVIMYTPPNSSPPGSPFAQAQRGAQHHHQFVGIGTNIVANDHLDGADEDERKLREVLGDASDQIREAKRVVTKSMMRNHKHRSVQVQLLKKLGATAIESIPFTKPKNAYEALQSVSLLISNVSSKLVPEMKQRQKHIVYVMRIMETYVRSMLSFFTKKDRADEDEDEKDEARSKHAIERILIKLQEAEAWTPPSLTNDQKQDADMKENMDRIIHLCETIKGAIGKLKTEKSDEFVSSYSEGAQSGNKSQLKTGATGIDF